MGAPSQIVEPIPPMVSAFTRGWGFVDEGVGASPPTSTTYQTSNQGVWHPVYVPTVTIATRMWWANGSTVSASYNFEAGLYRDTGAAKPGAKLATTGSVAQGTASAVQFAEFSPSADHRLDPGLYWLYISCSTTSATIFRGGISSTVWDELFLMAQSSVGPGSAPDPASPSEVGFLNVLYLVGFSTNTVT